MIATSSRSLSGSLGSSSDGEVTASSVSEEGGDDASANGRCKGCRYSEPANDGLRCVNDKFVFGYDVKSPPSDGVVVEEYEGWGFRVGPDFGCIHFVLPRRS
jgi:hypothetical protein